MFVNDKGRSMVEMLGVLAIIGVLSVGAISGYSKAMMKHKLNVHVSGINFLLQNALQFTSNLPIEDGMTNMTYLFDKLNIIPDGFRYEESGNSRIYDMFNSYIMLHGTTQYPTDYKWGLRYYIENTDFRFPICQNLLTAAKEFSGQLSYFTVTLPNGGQLNYYGDDYCTENRKCLKDIKLLDIENVCRTQDDSQNPGKTSYFSFDWF